MKFASKIYGLIGIIFAVILFLAVNVLGTTMLSGARVDFTEEKIYTLSDGTKKILGALEEPIRIRYFYSSETATGIPVVQSYAGRVEGLLRQYAGIAGSNIVLEFINPEPFSKDEDLAVSLGVQAVPINERGDKIFFGLTASNSVDETKEIAFFDPQREPFLEYDLTQIIQNLSRANKPVVGMLSSFNMAASKPPISIPGFPAFSGESWEITAQIENDYKVEHLELDVSEIPENIDVLMVFHPKGISAQALYAVDQYVMAGGKAIMFVDPYPEGGPPTQRDPSDLNKLFSAWGINVPANEIVADRDHGVRVQLPDENSRLRMLDKINWLALPAENMNGQDVITGELKQMRVVSTGHIVKSDAGDKAPEWTPLIHSSDNSMAVPISALDDPQGLLQNFKASGESFTLAGRLHGKAVSAFPEAAENENHINESSEDINVVVIADTDILRDDYWMRRQDFYGKTIVMQLADNASFLINALDNLSGSSELISLRSRSKTERPFEVVAELRREAEARFLEEEKRLQSRLQETEAKVAQLRSGAQMQQGNVLLSREQQREIEKFQQEMVKTRQSLREVQHSLRKDIEGLGNWLKFLNIGLMPFLIILLSFFIPARLGIRKA